MSLPPEFCYKVTFESKAKNGKWVAKESPTVMTKTGAEQLAEFAKSQGKFQKIKVVKV